MVRVGRDASLHEKTVKGATTARRRRRTRQPEPVFPVRQSQVHPLAWKHALKLAGGDKSRITILSATQLRVD